MNMLRRSVGRAVRSRIVPYVALYAVLLALHLQFTLGTGDDPMYAAMLDQYSLAYFSLWHYYTWSARTLIEAVVCIVEALPAIVWRLADPLCITLCAACIVRLARLEDRPAGRWAVCGLTLCYPWQDMSSAGWVCTNWCSCGLCWRHWRRCCRWGNLCGETGRGHGSVPRRYRLPCTPPTWSCWRVC